MRPQKVRDMIRKAATTLKRDPGGLGSGGAEPGASAATPVRAYRPVDIGRLQAGEGTPITDDLCRVVGFISLLKSSNSKAAWWKRQVER